MNAPTGSRRPDNAATSTATPGRKPAARSDKATAVAAWEALFGQVPPPEVVVTDGGSGIRSAMEEQDEGSKSILESIGTLNDITSQVKSGSRDMLAGSREVIQEGENLTRITGEVSGSMGEMAEGLAQITVAMNRINELSLTNKESIDILSGEVGKFAV